LGEALFRCVVGQIEVSVDRSSTKTIKSTGNLVETLAVRRPFGLTDAQWVLLEGLLSQPVRWGRPSLWSGRQLVDGIRWRVRTGSPWRELPGSVWVVVCGVCVVSAVAT
jgi:Putative transposase of IS4/5 family (DUF4096)